MVYNVPQDKLIQKTAVELKKKIDMPSWAYFVKTGAHKQRPPIDNDWWYMRAASILRRVYNLGPIGVSKLRVKYGGKKNKGVAPEEFYKGSGKIIRTILQQLEQQELIKEATVDKRKGRIVTPKGKSFLFSISNDIAKSAPKKEKKKPEKQEKTEKKDSKDDKKKTKKSKESKKDDKKEEKKETKKETKKDTKNKKDKKSNSKKSEE